MKITAALFRLAAFIALCAAPLRAQDLSISDAVVNEDGGAINISFNVTLSAAPAGPVTVDINMAEGTAVADAPGFPGDFNGTPQIAVPLLFAGPYPATVVVNVPMTLESLPELDETFSVTLSNAVNATIVNATATGTILESDITVLNWDPGTTDTGTVSFSPGPTGAASYRVMRIQPLDPANGAWRTRLTMAAGNADLYMALGRIPVGGAGDDFISDRGGADGWVLRPDEFNASQTWYLRVNTTAATTWTIVTGDAFVTPLGALPFTDANANLAYDIGEAVSPCVLPPGTDTIGPEGMRFYGVTIPAGTPGWSVWLGGDTREVAVRKNTVPFHISQSYYEHKQSGQMLLVPDFLGGNQEQAFLSVVGAPGTAIPLDSRIQTVSTLAFGGTTAVTAVAGAPYRVFRVTVPPAALAWDAVTTAVAGNPNVAIRRDAVPSEWFNDAVSEAPGGATDSVTLVPPFLTDGTWYITVYGAAPYSFTLFNGLPAIPVIPYVGATLNPQPLRAGTKHFVVTDIASQNGTLGWALALSGHIPGTEITLRRNAVPGRWMSRSGYHSALSGPSGPVDFNTTRSLLQRPGHQADVWYVGIFLPDVALGAFTLTRTAITPTPLAWNGGTAALGPLPPRQWSFFQFDVPATATGTLLGWDVRVTGDTAGAAQMDVRRDRLPEAIGAAWGTGSSSTVWPSGVSWGSFYDWTQRSNDGTGVPRYSKTLVSAFGRPLEPGRYYAGVFNSDEVTAANGALLSRGIGTGNLAPGVPFSLPSTPLAFAGGSVAIAGLAPREARYFQVTVPAGQPSWEVTLTATTGEMLLGLRQGAVPDLNGNETGDATASLFADGQVKMQKSGDERYLMLPPDGSATIPAGAYFLAVVSEGDTPPDDFTTGGGAVSGTLTSAGNATVTPFPAWVPAVISLPVTLLPGQTQLLTFNVPAGSTNFTAELVGTTGDIEMNFIPGALMPNAEHPGGSAYSYGQDGGSFPGRVATNRIATVVQPVTGLWSMTVNAMKSAPASATIRLTRNAVTALTFNGGSSTVTAQPPETWRFFTVTVPAAPLGWDLRIHTVTDGSPALVVRRDLLPDGTFSSFWNPSQSTTWPSGEQWGATNDWTSRQNDPSGPVPFQNRLICGAGQPLVAGTYLVGVYNNSTTNDATYTVQSRGIGAGLALPVTALAFAAGSSAVVPATAARQTRFFSVTVPAATPRWGFTLTATTGDWTVAARRGTIPDLLASASGDLDSTNPANDNEVLLHKTGSESFLMLPLDGAATLAAGTYFIAAMSHGSGFADDSTTGAANATATLTSLGVPPIAALGLASGVPIVSPHSLAPGQYRLFSFTVPPGATSMEVQIAGRTEEQFLAIMPGAALPDLDIDAGSAYSYGQDGGQSGPGRVDDTQIITVNTPAPGVWTGIVGAYSLNTAPATGSVSIVANTVTVLAFDGVTPAQSGHLPEAWRYFSVTVPAGAIGWDVGLRNITAGDPHLTVRRTSLPENINAVPSTFDSATVWNDGEYYAGSLDWTDRATDENGTTYYGRRRVTGMGRPLTPGTYIVGIYNYDALNPAAYTVESRGIGAGHTIPVTPLALNTGGTPAAIAGLAPREARYFSVVIPAGTTNWELTLTPTLGEMLMAVRRGTIPGFQAGFSGDAGTPYSDSGYDLQVKMQKDGAERYLMLPPEGMASLVPGTYFIVVAGEGVNPMAGSTGAGNVSGTLASLSPKGIVGLGAVGAVPVTSPVALFAGQSQLLAFNVPPGAPLLEARLDNRAGNPLMSLIPGTLFPAIFTGGGSLYDYGNDGGASITPAGREDDYSVISIRNPSAGAHRLITSASYTSDATATLSLRTVNFQPLNFDATLNGGGGSNTATMMLLDGQRALFQVEVPLQISGSTVAGWRLTLTERLGNAKVRVFRTWGQEFDAVTISGDTGIIVPPWLQLCRTCFVEVEGEGLTDVTLTSAALLPRQGPFTLPASFNVEFGNTGSVSLAEGGLDYYPIDVPADNLGLLRTALEVISGNADLYLREDGPPTLDHSPAGGFGAIYHRSMIEATGSEYGNWVPVDGRTQPVRLRPGRWWAAVKAQGSNATYRLRLSSGTVTTLPGLTTGPLAAQLVLDRDWRYYRFTMPLDAPVNWSQTFSQQLGDVVMHIRDTVPPGAGTYATHDFANAAADNKNFNDWPYFGDDAVGTYTRTCPPLRPGATYFIGFRGTGADSTFTFSTSTAGGTIGTAPTLDFYTGVLANPALGAGDSMLRRVIVPALAGRWRHSFTSPSADMHVTVEQGSLPSAAGFAHYEFTAADSSLDTELATHLWPWQPSQTYWVRVTNNGAGPAAFTLTMNGADDPNLVDADGDLIPDAWEILHFGNIAPAPAGDPDNDGSDNRAEFAFATLPADTASLVTAIIGATAGPDSRLTITFNVPDPAPAYLRYTVEATTDLVNWTPLAVHAPAGSWTEWTGPGYAFPPVPQSPGILIITVADCETIAANPRRILRVRAGP